MISWRTYIYIQWRRSVFRIGGGKTDHWVKTLYVYLLTSSILYKNNAYFGGGEMVYSPAIFIIVWQSLPCSPRIDTPVYIYGKHPYKRVRFLATFGLRFTVLSYRTHEYEHLEENMPLAPLFTEI